MSNVIPESIILLDHRFELSGVRYTDPDLALVPCRLPVAEDIANVFVAFPATVMYSG